jgi:hypothetical protein
MNNQAIYEFLKDLYENVYFQRFPQSLNLINAVPNILVYNESESEPTGKENTGRTEVFYRIEVIGKIYSVVYSLANQIKTSLKSYSDEDIYLNVFETQEYDFSEESEVHRLILNFKTYIH